MRQASQLLTLAIAIGAPVVVAMARESATVYILPIPKDAAEWAGRMGMAPATITPDALFSVEIDGARTVQVDRHRGAVVDGLDANGPHTVRVALGGKPYARFKFSFESWKLPAGRKRLAIYMDAMYSNWRVWRCDRVRRCDDVQVDGGIPDASRAP